MISDELKEFVEQRTGVTDAVMPEEGIEVPKVVYFPCLVSGYDQMRMQLLDNDDVEFAYISSGRYMHSVIVNKESVGDMIMTLGLWGFTVPTE